MIHIGDQVTLAPRVTILAHDASTQHSLRVTKIGRVNIGNQVFVGAGAMILPGVTIGNNVVIGAGSVVTNDIPSNSIAVGNPAQVIRKYEDFVIKHQSNIREGIVFGSEFLYPEITENNKTKMNDILNSSRYAYLVRKTKC